VLRELLRLSLHLRACFVGLRTERAVGVIAEHAVRGNLRSRGGKQLAAVLLERGELRELRDGLLALL
jgi:hypothetical protein